MRPTHLIALTHVACLLILAGATGCHGVKRGDLNKVTPISDKPRVGKVYLVRGLVGVFSTGMDELSVKLREQGISAEVFQGEQRAQLAAAIAKAYANNPRREPLVLIGHSYGADDVLRIARELEAKNITVDLVVTCDAVTPPKVPSNIRELYNYYKPNGAWDNLPWLRGIPLSPDEKKAVKLANYDLTSNRRDLLERNTNHFNIEKNAKLHKDIIQRVHKVCPPRPVWAAMQNKTVAQAEKPSTPEPALSTADASQ